MSNSTLELGTEVVKYSYELKDFKENYARLSNRTVHSAVNCSLIEVEQGLYWRWNNWNKTGPFSMQEFRPRLIIHGASISDADFELG